MSQPTITNDALTETRMVWIRALESGEYSQTRRVLKDEKGYCCIGVAREVHPNLNNYQSDYYEIAEAYGYVAGRALDFSRDTTESVLIKMNDYEENTFTEIAAYLRELWGLQDAV
jgi:hypothetical protein